MLNLLQGLNTLKTQNHQLPHFTDEETVAEKGDVRHSVFTEMAKWPNQDSNLKTPAEEI